MEPIPEYDPANELDENALNVFPYADAFEPYTRPLRKPTNVVNFPPGFSPFDDARDPGADPNAYPPPPPKHFGESLRRGRANVEGWGALQLLAHIRESLFWDTPLQPTWYFRDLTSWQHVPNVPVSLQSAMIFNAAPFITVYFYARLIDLWRHSIGGWFYTFYYIAMANGQLNRTDCWRVLREGPNRRFTVNSQFWFRRGCEGSVDGFLARGHLMDNPWDFANALFLNNLFTLPRGILHAVVLVIFWGFFGGFGWDFLYYIVTYVVWICQMRIWPLAQDTFDWKFIGDFFLHPWLNKVEQIWTAIWAVFLGFNIHAIVPHGQGQPNAGQGVPVEQAAVLLDEVEPSSSGGSEGGAPGQGGDGNWGPGPDSDESSDSDDNDFGPDDRAHFHQGHFIAQGNPVPPGLIVQGLVVDGGEFIVQGGGGGVQNEHEEQEEEEEEFDIDHWLRENPGPVVVDIVLNPQDADIQVGNIPAAESDDEEPEEDRDFDSYEEELRARLGPNVNFRADDDEVGSIVAGCSHDDEREQELDFEALEAEADAQRAEMNLNTVDKYVAYHGNSDDDDELESPGPRQGNTGAIHSDKLLYRGGSGGSDPPTLLEKIGPEQENEEAQGHKEGQDLQGENESAEAHQQWLREEERRQEQLGEEEDESNETLQI